jgi:hypothetical protein
VSDGTNTWVERGTYLSGTGGALLGLYSLPEADIPTDAFSLSITWADPLEETSAVIVTITELEGVDQAQPFAATGEGNNDITVSLGAETNLIFVGGAQQVASTPPTFVVDNGSLEYTDTTDLAADGSRNVGALVVTHKPGLTGNQTYTVSSNVAGPVRLLGVEVQAA